jgi:chemotaxis signal transduction protein
LKDNYIVFSVAGTAYALPSQDVAHVELVEQVTRVPNAPPFVDGVVFSRGAVVPAVNARVRFGFPSIPYDTRTRLIVAQRNGRTIGLIVDEAREFLAIADGAVQPPAEGLTGTSGRYIRAVATVGERMILVLDLTELLNVDELSPAVNDGAARSQETQ